MVAEAGTLVSPYGGIINDLCAPAASRAELPRYAETLPSVQITERSRCNLERKASGAFSSRATLLSRAAHEDRYEVTPPLGRRVDTTGVGARQNARPIVGGLRNQGFVR